MTATALTEPARPARQRALRPTGLTWTLLRVHRSALWFWLMYVAVAAGVLLWLYGPGANAAMDELVRSGCRDGGAPDLGCDMLGPAGSRWDYTVALAGGMIALAPILIAAWAGGSLIGRELEDGTARLAWTQSVSPARWLAAKLTVPAVLIIAGMIPLTLLYRMMWAANPELREFSWHWFDYPVFNANGVLATVYPLFGLAFGALVGMVTRRSLPGLGVSLVGAGIVVQQLLSLRPYLWPAETQRSTDELPEVWMPVGEGSYTSTGARLGEHRDYHPPSHFWPLQLVETGIVLALATVAALIAFAVLRRRTGAAV
ncbi:ABC transporter permease [Streptomyces sp. NPDC047042]|uniref:ABC transporter permease n=1 Tax=Streptomyces sp. NPDC047042 TaxID=3154807 RepID=UPI0033CA43ED